jgi:hypothetical protein
MLFLRYYLWIAPNLLLVPFLWLFLRRRFHVQLPSLLVYATLDLMQLIASVVSRLISPFPINAYQWVVLVVGNGLLSVAELWVIYELWAKLVFSRSPLARVGRLLLACSLAVLLLTAAALSGTLPGIYVVHPVGNISEILDFSSSLILTGLLIILFVFSRALQISWRSWMVGIALGFGIYGCADLSSAAWRAALGRKALIPVDIVQEVAFHLCVLVWIAYLLLPEHPKFTGTGLERDDLEAWSEQMGKIAG